MKEVLDLELVLEKNGKGVSLYVGTVSTIVLEHLSLILYRVKKVT